MFPSCSSLSLVVEAQRFWLFFVFCITNNKLYLHLGSRGKNHLLGQQRYWGIRASDISCGISGFVARIGGHPSAPGAGGPVRSLSVSWRTKEVPPLQGHWYLLALCADTQEWACREFVYWIWAQTIWTFESKHAQYGQTRF